MLKERQTFHPVSTPDGQAQDATAKLRMQTDRMCSGGQELLWTSVSTKEVTDKDVRMEGRQEQFSKPDERSPEI